MVTMPLKIRAMLGMAILVHIFSSLDRSECHDGLGPARFMEWFTRPSGTR